MDWFQLLNRLSKLQPPMGLESHPALQSWTREVDDILSVLLLELQRQTLSSRQPGVVPPESHVVDVVLPTEAGPTGGSRTRRTDVAGALAGLTAAVLIVINILRGAKE